MKASNKLKKSIFSYIYNEMPWKQIKAFRNIIVHNYGSIDFDNVWNTSKIDIPKLNRYCKKILKENE